MDDDGPVVVAVKTPEDDIQTFRSTSNSVGFIRVVPGQGVWIKTAGDNLTLYPMNRVLKVDMRARLGSVDSLENQQLD